MTAIVATKSPQQGAFIGGLIGGFAVGGVVLMPAAVIVAMLVFQRFTANQNYAFIAVYALGAALGLWALALGRKRIDFISGFVAGGAAGLLGLTALCNVLIGGMGGMR